MTERETIYYMEQKHSQLGTILAAATERGLCQLAYDSFAASQEELRSWSIRYLATDRWQESADHPLLLEAHRQLDEYFTDRRQQFELNIDLHGTPFQQTVWQALQHIPYGETRSYSELAAYIKHPKAVRAVGGANNKNPLSIVIPCHRVIGANGDLIGYGGGLDYKQKLLELERVFV